jgi:hypothetical protein
MDLETYLTLCSNTKLLNKALTRKEAADIFKRALFRLGIKGDLVTFFAFREGVITDFAIERGMDTVDLLDKLARFDPPEELYRPKILNSMSTQEDSKHHHAVMKIQKITRAKAARRRFQGLVQVKI